MQSDIEVRREVRTFHDSELLDERDRVYDAMVAAGENGRPERADRLSFVLDVIDDVCDERNLIDRLPQEGGAE